MGRGMSQNCLPPRPPLERMDARWMSWKWESLRFIWRRGFGLIIIICPYIASVINCWAAPLEPCSWDFSGIETLYSTVHGWQGYYVLSHGMFIQIGICVGENNSFLLWNNASVVAWTTPDLVGSKPFWWVFWMGSWLRFWWDVLQSKCSKVIQDPMLI